MKTLKKRLKEKSNVVALLSLTVCPCCCVFIHCSPLSPVQLLDSLVKTCPQFHRWVGSSDFMDSFVKTLPDKVESLLEFLALSSLARSVCQVRDPQKKSMFKVADTTDTNALERVDRTLLLIQMWGKEFAASKSYPVFRECYNNLLAKGSIPALIPGCARALAVWPDGDPDACVRRCQVPGAAQG